MHLKCISPGKLHTAETKVCWIDNDVCYARFVILRISFIHHKYLLCCQNCVQGCCGDGV